MRTHLYVIICFVMLGFTTLAAAQDADHPGCKEPDLFTTVFFASDNQSGSGLTVLFYLVDEDGSFPEGCELSLGRDRAVLLDDEGNVVHFRGDIYAQVLDASGLVGDGSVRMNWIIVDINPPGQDIEDRDFQLQLNLRGLIDLAREEGAARLHVTAHEVFSGPFPPSNLIDSQIRVSLVGSAAPDKG